MSKPVTELSLLQLDAANQALANQAEALQANEIFPPLDWGDPHRVYAAAIGNSIVGVANVVVKPGEITVNTMCVSPKHRNQGIGSALLNHVTNAGAREGCREAWLTPTNYKNERLYRRLGFDFPPGGVLAMYKSLR